MIYVVKISIVKMNERILIHNRKIKTVNGKQVKTFELKNTVSEINSLDGLNNTLGMNEERIR